MQKKPTESGKAGSASNVCVDAGARIVQRPGSFCGAIVMSPPTQVCSEEIEGLARSVVQSGKTSPILYDAGSPHL